MCLSRVYSGVSMLYDSTLRLLVKSVIKYTKSDPDYTTSHVVDIGIT